MNKKNEEETRSKAYIFKDFQRACDKCQRSVLVSKKAIKDALNSPLNLDGKRGILNYIAQQNEKDFVYINTDYYKNGIKGENPLVDAYNQYLNYWVLYVAFLKVKIDKNWFWYIKSFHSDKKGGAAPIGNIAKIIGKNNEK